MSVTHGHTKGRKATPIYTAWQGMHKRCYNQKFKYYGDYGGRGIRVCERWHTFENFLEDMTDSWALGLEIDRMDNDGDYTPDNCQWATRHQQSRNKRNNVWLSLGNKTQILADWSRETGLNPQTIQDRLAYGWSVEKALTTPPLH
jgi:hypothetical protein